MTSPLSPEAVAQMVADLTTEAQAARQAYRADVVASYTTEATPKLDDYDIFMGVLVVEAVSDMLTTLAAENAALRAENEELDFLRHEGGPDSVAAMEIELAMLRAPEAAAWARVTTALEIAQTRHIPDQPAAYGGSELEWAQRQYASLRRDIIAALTPTADKEPTRDR